MVTAQDLFDALREVDERQDSYFQGFISQDDDLKDVIIDGRFDLEAVAEVLNRKSAEQSSQ